jgi:hypothetical protein
LLYASHTRSGKELKKRLEASPPRQSNAPERFVERKPAVHLYSQQPVNPTNQGISESMLQASGLFVGQSGKDDVALMSDALSGKGKPANPNQSQRDWLSIDSINHTTLKISKILIQKDLQRLYPPTLPPLHPLHNPT